MAAQTFPQLYRELKTAGYRPDDVQRVHHAHEAASRLFAGAYRPTYKPFVCHLVGTASVLARHRERVELIAAALVHSAYQLADFGDGSYGGPAKNAALFANGSAIRPKAWYTTIT